MNSHQKCLSSCLLLIAAFVCSPTPGAAAAAAAPNLGSAGTFAVLSAAPLAGGAVTLTNSTVIGDVGSTGAPASVVLTSSTIVGAIIAPVSSGVVSDFNQAYVDLAAVPCDVTLSGTLANVTLPPGVYCFPAAAALTGTLTLSGPSNGIWIFKIGDTAVGALTGTNFSVVMEGGGDPCNVYWWVDAAATMTDSNFVGTILAGAAITITRGTFTGNAYAKAAVTMTDSLLASCVAGGTAHTSIKVTGGGQIPVPDPNSTGRATFGFNAQSDKSGGAKGHFNYVNHVTGLHIEGPVTDIQVIAFNPDGSPKTVLFSGTCGTGCAFTVTVEDHGEPGTSDQFGLVVTGTSPEARSQRVISRGNIQFHK